MSRPRSHGGWTRESGSCGRSTRARRLLWFIVRARNRARSAWTTSSPARRCCRAFRCPSGVSSGEREVPAMPWDSEQSERSKAEQAQPFRDRLGLVAFQPEIRIVDLGCGTGELTAELAARSPDGDALGIDPSRE